MAREAAAAYLSSRGYDRVSELLSGSTRPSEIEVKDLLRDEFASGPTFRRRDLRLALHLHPDEDGTGYAESFRKFDEWLDGGPEWLQHELKDLRFPLLLHCFIGQASRGEMEQARTFLKGYIQSLTTDAQRTSATSLCEIKQTSQLHDHDVVRRYLVHRSTIFCSPGAWEALCSFLVGSHLLLLLILTVKYFEVHAMATQPAREKPLLSPAPASAPQPPSSAKSPGTAVATESRTLLPLPRTRAAPPSVCIVTQSSSHIDMCSCDLAPSSGTIAFGRADGALQLCRFSSAEAVSSRYRCKPTSLQSQYREAYGHSGPVYSCVTSFDGQFVLSGSQDGSVRLWSWRHATGLAAYANHSFPVWHVSFASHHSHFLSSCYDGGVRLFDTRRLTPLRLMAGHMSDVNAARFHPSDAYALSGSHDCTLRLWDIASSGCVRLMLGHKAPVNDVAVGLRSEVAASGSDDETVRLWDLGSGQARATLSHAEPVRQVLFSSNGKIVAAVGTKFIRVWSCDAALTAAGAGSAEAEPLVSCESPVRLVGASFLNDSPILLACGLGEDPVLSAIM